MLLRNFFSSKGSPTASIFLNAHALRDPLTAIRWGVGTLRKAKQGALSPDEQKRMLDAVYSESRTLTTIVESMMLMAELEHGVYLSKKQEIALKSFFTDIMNNFEQAENSQRQVECDDVIVLADEKILRSVLLTILTVRSDSLKTPVNMLIRAKESNHEVIVDFYISLVFPVLHSEETTPLLAGAPALLLSLAHSLAGKIEGSVIIEKKVAGNFVPLAETETEEDHSPANHFKISLRIPASKTGRKVSEQERALVA